MNIERLNLLKSLKGTKIGRRIIDGVNQFCYAAYIHGNLTMKQLA
jgi:hypothetical protein